MKKISLFVIVDFVFKFALVFMINIIWCLYFLKIAWLSIMVATILSFAILLVCNLLGKKRKNKNFQSLKEIEHIENVKNTFVFMQKDELVDFFYNLASKKHKATKKDNYVLIENDKNTILYPLFKMSSLTCDEVIQIYNSINKENVKKIVLACNSYEPNINSIIDNFDCKIIILDYKQTYSNLLKPYEFFPKVKKITNKKPTNTFSKILQTSFNKKKTRSYVLSALFILFASYFVKYRIYYLIVASILIIFAILCQFEYKFNKVQKEELLS